MEHNKHTPRCIGIIMDGNRRWATEQGLSPLEGHKKGYDKIKEVVGWVKDAHIPYLIAYAFSTENWNRSEKEVSHILNLFRTFIEKEVEKLHTQGVRIIFVGDLARFPQDLQADIQNAHEKTKDNTQLVFTIAVSYGGHAEILSAVNKSIENKKGNMPITEKEFVSHLWTHGTPDPDIIIRTGGEQRLSNFLPWQSVYSELYFLKTHWPAFSKKEFSDSIKNFATRNRRMGI